MTVHDVNEATITDRTAASDAEQPTMPSVTCVVVAYNHAKYVEEALDSAFALTYPNLRIMVTDDASTDNSADLIRKHLADTGHGDVTFIAHDENKGLCATLNEALTHIDSDYVAFISADDLQEPNRFDIQVAQIEDLGPRYGFAFSDMCRITEDGVPLDQTWFERMFADGSAYRAEGGDIYRRLLDGGYFIPAPSILARTILIRSSGGYDEALRFEDIDMTLRIASVSMAAYTKRPLVKYRQVRSSLTHVIRSDPVALSADMRAIYRKHIGRDDAIDRIVARQLQIAAKSAYFAGASAKSVVGDFRFALRHRTSIASPVFYCAALFRIPGAAIAPVATRMAATIRFVASQLRRSPSRRSARGPGTGEATRSPRLDVRTGPDKQGRQ